MCTSSKKLLPHAGNVPPDPNRKGSDASSRPLLAPRRGRERLPEAEAGIRGCESSRTAVRICAKCSKIEHASLGTLSLATSFGRQKFFRN